MTVTERAALLAVRIASLNGLPLGVRGCIAASKSSSLLPAIAALDSHACGISSTFVADYVHHDPATLLSITRGVKTSSIPGAGAAGGSTGTRAYASGGADNNHELLASHAAHSERHEAGRNDSPANKQEGDTYYATPAYPNTTPDDGSAGDAAAAASRSLHPAGPADTSSMNASEGKRSHDELNRQRNAADIINSPAEHQEELQLEGRQTVITGGSHRPTAPDTPPVTPQEDEVIRGSPSSNHSSHASGARRLMSSFSSPAAALGNTADGRQHCYGGENTASSNGRSTDGTADAANNKVEDDNVEGGANGGIAGAWRAMTSDFAAGGDDMTGGGSAGTVAEDQAMAVNPDSGLPQLKSVDDAGAASSGFGQKRDPQQAPEEGGDQIARQTQHSTGQMPSEAASG